jgi:cytochrome P450
MPTRTVQADPFTAGCPGQRHAIYRELGAGGPIHRITMPTGQPAWLITGYQEARAALTDPRLVKGMSPATERAWELAPELAPAVTTHMLRVDGPDHTRLRRLVSAAFTRRRIEGLAPRIQRIADELLDEVAAADRFDLIPAYAAPLPLIVICELLGVPEEARADFRAWTTTIVGGIFTDPDEFASALAESVTYLRGLLDRRRRRPDDGLLSALVTMCDDDGDRLTEDELTSMVWILVAAGHETTVNLIASGVHALLTHPDQLARLRAHPELIDTCVEELLRYESPLQVSLPLRASEPLEIAGIRIAAGDVVLPGLLAANRDPHHAGDPDALDIGREHNQHLAFGHGVHHCLGAPLARLEARIALRVLLARLPELRLAGCPEELRWRSNVLIHGLESLQVTPGAVG